MYGNNTFLGNNSGSGSINGGGADDQLTLIPDPLAQVANQYCTSSYGGSPTSLASGSCCTSCSSCSSSSMIQRSISTHSFQNNAYHSHFTTSHPLDFSDMDSTSPVRRVFSTGDLQQGHRAESPLSSESSMIIESMSRACKYSPEEKKERIERYRTRRNQRNFNKKIKYACRKILADSRPRIRGRFARNDEIEQNPQLQWSNNVSGEEDEEDDENWINLLMYSQQIPFLES